MDLIKSNYDSANESRGVPSTSAAANVVNGGPNTTIREKRNPRDPKPSTRALVYFIQEGSYACEKAADLIPKDEDRVVGKEVQASFKGKFYPALVLGIDSNTAVLAEIEKKHLKAKEKEKVAQPANQMGPPVATEKQSSKRGRPKGSVNKDPTLLDPNSFESVVRNAAISAIGGQATSAAESRVGGTRQTVRSVQPQVNATELRPMQQQPVGETSTSTGRAIAQPAVPIAVELPIPPSTSNMPVVTPTAQLSNAQGAEANYDEMISLNATVGVLQRASAMYSII